MSGRISERRVDQRSCKRDFSSHGGVSTRIFFSPCPANVANHVHEYGADECVLNGKYPPRAHAKRRRKRYYLRRTT